MSDFRFDPPPPSSFTRSPPDRLRQLERNLSSLSALGSIVFGVFLLLFLLGGGKDLLLPGANSGFLNCAQLEQEKDRVRCTQLQRIHVPLERMLAFEQGEVPNCCDEIVVGDLHRKGWKLSRAGEHQRALMYFQRAAEQNPASYDSLQMVGVTYRALGKYPEAIGAGMRTLERFPGYAKAHCSLGWAHERNGNYVEAAASQLNALSLAPDWEFAQKRLNTAAKHLNNEELLTALQGSFLRDCVDEMQWLSNPTAAGLLGSIWGLTRDDNGLLPQPAITCLEDRQPWHQRMPESPRDRSLTRDGEHQAEKNIDF